MRKIIIVAVLVLLLIVVIALSTTKPNYDNQLLRIHIRADSNSKCDQDVKYQVKSSVVNYLTPYLAECKSISQAKSVINSHLSGIVDVANKTLASKGFNYHATASVVAEQFPVRSYNGVVVSGGVYDSLIINLGSGSGDNWWCVVYPPLCFVGEGQGSVQYASKLKEIIDNWANSN